MALLNKEQVKILKDKSWDNVKEDGCFVHLYIDEIEPIVWDNICKIAGLPADAKEIKLLILASASL